jgi:multidrug efflux pump subunit AcrA (membrane-fusion protein)
MPRLWKHQKLERSAFVFVFALIMLTSCSEKRTSEAQLASDRDHAKTKESAPENRLPTVPVVEVRKEKLEKTVNLPGELLAYQDVPVHAKVEGYIKWIGVDRGSIVKKGQKMITIFCPELDEKAKEAAAKMSAAQSAYRQAQANEDAVRSKLVEAKARLDADRLTFVRLQQAAQTPGAIAQNEVDLQEKSVESDQARVQSVSKEASAAANLVVAEKHNVKAAEEVLNALKDMTAYLTIAAPFNGVITERNVHEGSIVAVDASRSALPLVRVQQTDLLRLVVAVPEDSVSGTKIGQKFQFTVPAFVGRTFEGIVARPAYALDTTTRTMPVEMNVYNAKSELEPGMFATVKWLVSRPYDTLFVPAPAVKSDLKGTFVIRVKDNVTERVEVQRGLAMGNEVEISGKINASDLVALKATDELKTGTRLIAKLADSNDVQKASQHSSAGGE